MPSCCKRRLFQYPFASFTAARSRFPSAATHALRLWQLQASQTEQEATTKGDATMARHIDFALPLNDSLSLFHSLSLSPLSSVCRTIKFKRAMPDADTQVKSSQGESAKIKL